MRKKKVDYFEFLYSFGFVDDDHRALAGYLHSMPFEWSLERDENRMYDGLAMRREYEEYLNNEEGDIPDDSEPCSMLEFFVGFSHRLVRDMFGNEDFDRTELLGIMLSNLDIWCYTDDNFDDRAKEDINECLDIFVHREYNAHGEGGLFPIDEPDDDLRDVDMWVQASWWYNENFN